MIKKVITYKDFLGNERTETHLFHLSESELTEMQLSINGGLDEFLNRIVASRDESEIASIFKKLILTSYGIMSLDGKRFEKSEAISTEFSQTNAYNELYMELATDSKKAAEFVNGIIPDSIRTKVAEMTADDANLQALSPA